MPLLLEKKSLSSIKDLQRNCTVCEKAAQRNEIVFKCDICNIWTCKECSQVNEKLIEVASKNNIKLNFVCNSCKEDAPKIRSLMKITARQDQMEKEVEEINKKVDTNTSSINDLTQDQKDMDSRLKTIEKVIKENRLADYGENFPPLVEITEKISTQEESTAKLNSKIEKQREDKEEEALKSTKALNLIIYGVPEHENDPIEQMKQDFLALCQIYETKLDIEKTDITNITRIGKKIQGKIRPIKITCANHEVRKEILTNNQYLRLSDDSFEDCNCKKEPGKHIHVNVTTDKTKKEQEEESLLINELKERKANGEDVIIKRGKVIPREKARRVQARWTEISQNV